MKILGHVKLKARSQKVLVGQAESGEPVYLTMYAPKLNAYEALQEEIPDPEVPMNGKVLRNKRGKILLDEDGQHKREANPECPKYLARVAKSDKARSIALVLKCLGDQIEPETQKGSMSAEEYYLAIYQELQDAGIDIAAFHALTMAASELSQPLTDEDFKDSKKALGVDEESQSGLEEGK
tara:strand:+ start:119 stop:661 length:543 start_codon:yes stop_codon:yes gene_type:complete